MEETIELAVAAVKNIREHTNAEDLATMVANWELATLKISTANHPTVVIPIEGLTGSMYEFRNRVLALLDEHGIIDVDFVFEGDGVNAEENNAEEINEARFGNRTVQLEGVTYEYGELVEIKNHPYMQREILMRIPSMSSDSE